MNHYHRCVNRSAQDRNLSGVMPSFLVVLFSALFQACPCRIIGQQKRGRNDPTLAMSSQPQEVESKEMSCRQFFAAFNEHVNERVDKADQVRRVSSEISDILLVSMSTIMEEEPANISLSGGSEHTVDFVQKFAANGGSALVKLSEKDAQVMSNMWGLAKTVFDEIDRQKGKETEHLGLRYQNLIRGNDKETASTKEEVGYSYVETNNREESLRALEEIVGNASASKAASDSLNHLTVTGTQLAAVVAAPLISLEPAKAQTLMQHVIGRPHDEKSISFQRFDRYMEASTERKQTENLGSHCDWSIFTIVPVSEVAGLQVFDVSSQTWICPEAVAREHAAQESSFGYNLPEGWNGAYAVVMAGKWLELLTNGKVESTIHRVVSPRNTPRRYSAPFFLRLNLYVLDALENVTLEHPDDVLASRLAISKFLQRLPTRI